MDFPVPGASLNSSIISQWQQPTKRPASRNRAKIPLNAASTAAPAASGSGTSSPLRKGVSRGGSPAIVEDDIIIVQQDVRNGKEAAVVEEAGDGVNVEMVPTTSSSGGKRAYGSSTLTPTQPSTKRTRSSRATDASHSRSAPGPSQSSGMQSRESLLIKYPPPDLKLSLLGGLQDQITQLLEMVALPLLHPEIYRHTGVRAPRGVLLHGVPGGGKTRLVTCLAGELQVPFISISAPSLVSSLSGDTEKLLRQTFDEAKSIAPCILFLDEVDAITPKRENAQREMEKRIVGQLLTCLDGKAKLPSWLNKM
jgi:SpoVK/Ycf46/Vps4 family AAA+-type ATPase